MRPKEDPHTQDCEGCDFAATESTEDRETRREERTKRAENLHTQDKARERDATKAKEEAVKDVAESMHECNQHEQEQ